MEIPNSEYKFIDLYLFKKGTTFIKAIKNPEINKVNDMKYKKEWYSFIPLRIDKFNLSTGLGILIDTLNISLYTSVKSSAAVFNDR